MNANALFSCNVTYGVRVFVDRDVLRLDILAAKSQPSG